MTHWVASVLLLAVTGITVLAEDATFIENLRNPPGSRIVSGWEAKEGQLPHQLSLRMVNPVGGVSSCGGSVISSKWGITAAHCTAGRVTLVVRIGLVNLTTPQYIFETTEYYNYPLYNEAIPSVVQTHDVGILKFGIVLEFSDLVQPIRLQNSGDKDRNYGGEKLIASGWGRTWTNGPSPENLNWVYLVGDTQTTCFLFYPSIVGPPTICASHYNVTSQSTCQGDSGGPLTVVDNDGKLSMVGIASFVSGLGCHADRPAGFVRPGHYHEWYEEITGESFDWKHDEPEPSTEEPELPTDEPEPPATTDESDSDSSDSSSSDYDV